MYLSPHSQFGSFIESAFRIYIIMSINIIMAMPHCVLYIYFLDDFLFPRVNVFYSFFFYVFCCFFKASKRQSQSASNTVL